MQVRTPRSADFSLRTERLAWTMHEGMDFRGHASEYRDVET
jgi:hypothetical protein